jgi:hypothetical protein
MLGAAAGLGFGSSDVAIKALSADLESGIGGLLRPRNALVGTAAVAAPWPPRRACRSATAWP